MYDIAGIVSDTQIKPSDRFGYVIRLDHVELTAKKSLKKLYIRGLIDIHVPRIIWLLPGDEITITNAKLKSSLNTPLEAWAIRHGIAATTFVENSQLTKKGTTPSIARSITEYKIKLLKKIKPHLSDNAYRLFKTLILGMTTNSNATDILRCKFQTWGLSHMLARSGLHMTLIAITISLALSPLGIASTATLLLNLLLLMGLCFLSWNGLSFMRAIYMWILAQLCIYLKRRPNVMHNLGLVATGCLLWQPYFVFSLDFQLTFFVTAILIIINSRPHINVMHKGEPLTKSTKLM